MALPFVWPYWLIFWPLIVWGFTIESRYMRRALATGGAKRAEDRGSMLVVVLGSYVASLVAFFVAFRAPAAAMPHRVAMFWLGLAIFTAGSLLRRHCFRVLGRYFTFDVQVQADQPVIESGAYRWIRHPSYSGGILMFAGIGLALGNWLSFALLVIAIPALYAYRIRTEERALLSQLGQPYADYMRRTKRLIPWII
jgi:protein-S-isoprenylcysteine O-methyltransferase Ste14